MRWFATEYEGTSKAVPIMIHPSIIIDRQATAVENMHIMTEEKLEVLKKRINEFAISVTQDCNWLDEDNIDDLLVQYNLRNTDLIDYYTCLPKKE